MELMNCGWEAGGHKVILGKSQFLIRQNESDFNQRVVRVHNKLPVLLWSLNLEGFL